MDESNVQKPIVPPGIYNILIEYADTMVDASNIRVINLDVIITSGQYKDTKLILILKKKDPQYESALECIFGLAKVRDLDLNGAPLDTVAQWMFNEEATVRLAQDLFKPHVLYVAKWHPYITYP